MSQKFCTKCGCELKPGLKFCTHCGAPLKVEENAQVIDSPIEQPTSKIENTKAAKDCNTIIAIIAIIVSVLIFVSCFGVVAEPNTDFSSFGDLNKIDFLYFFKAGPDHLTSIYNQSNSFELFGVELTLFIIETVLFFVGAISSILFSILMVIRSIKSLKQGDEVNLKFMIIAAVVRLASILFIVARRRLSSSASYYFMGIDYGWGAILFVVSFAIALVCLFAQKIIKMVYCKKTIAAVILRFVAVVTTFVLMFVVFSPLSKTHYIGGFVNRLSGIYLAEVAFSNYSYSTSGNLDLVTVFCGLISFVFVIAGLSTSTLTIRSAFNDKKVSTIVLSGISLVSLVVASILSLKCTEQLYPSGPHVANSFDTGPIVGIVLIAAIVIPCFIASNLLEKKNASKQSA